VLAFFAAARRLGFAHGSTVFSQLGEWVMIMGVCLKLTLDWSRRQFSRLATAP
jgi:hypothetical protein